MPDIKVKGYSGTDLAYENVEKIWLTSKSGSGRETLLAEQELEFTKVDGEVIYATAWAPAPNIAADDTVTISWDGVEYTCIYKVLPDDEDIYYAGNEALIGVGDDTGEPFCLMSIIVGDDSAAQIGTFSTDPTHTVAIYKGSTGAALVPFTYGELLTGVEVTPDFEKGDQQISVPDGSLVKEATILKPDTLLPENIKSGVEIAGVVGEYALETEETTVELDFSGGDMIVEPTEGKFLSRVDIPKPETLVPENIAKDVTIAGVVGTHEGGGGVRFIYRQGSFAARAGTITVNHGLGVAPFLIYVFTSYTVESKCIRSIFGLSKRILANQDMTVYYSYNTGHVDIGFSVSITDSDANTEKNGAIRNADETKFQVGGGEYFTLQNGATYNWRAIGILE